MKKLGTSFLNYSPSGLFFYAPNKLKGEKYDKQLSRRG